MECNKRFKRVLLNTAPAAPAAPAAESVLQRIQNSPQHCSSGRSKALRM